MTSVSHRTGATSVVFRKELVELLRDRRAIFFAFVVPLLLYPVLFISMSAMSRTTDETANLKVGFSGGAEPFVPYLEGHHLLLEELEFDAEVVRRGDVALFLSVVPGKRDGLESLTLYHVATSPSSQEALKRVEGAVDRYSDDLIQERFATRGVAMDPARAVSVEALDLSTEAERSDSRLGRLLPLLLVLLLLSGGSFAALDVVAGEKERGTLETLYIHPIARMSIVRGKFLVVLTVSLIALAFNFVGFLMGSMLASYIGFEVKALGSGAIVLPPVGKLALILVLTLPLAVLTSSILLAISAFSRSFREAQAYLLPVTLVALAVGLLAISPHVGLASVVAVVPIANVALAIRETLQGTLSPLPFAVALASSTLYAWLALRKAYGLLQREDLVLGLEPPTLLGDSSAETRKRRALSSASVLILFLYFAATWFQTMDLVLGLVVTLWGFVLVPALLYPLAVKVPFRQTLGLRAAPFSSYLLVPFIAASAVVLVNAYANLQQAFLPTPPGMEDAMKDLLTQQHLSAVAAFFLFAVSPGICEELLWRGAFQGELEPSRRPWRSILLVGLFFGVFHLSIYRLIPTALVGVALAVLRHRCGSIFPCMLVHALYNAILLFLATYHADNADLESFLTNPAVLLIAGGVLAFGLGAQRRLVKGG
jgi:sodium transport system permease protein